MPEEIGEMFSGFQRFLYQEAAQLALGPFLCAHAKAAKVSLDGSCRCVAFA
jgi:hypothetical protein